ncbi:MAG TPA: lysophospholipid acyltransferase family protein [Candidatus Bathyarchaeia archaeon]|nr:lysophospholipid acyltransferase family protein [Candidatus Bathyarchaeia archaeon]
MLAETVKDIGKLTFRFVASLASSIPGPVRGLIVDVCAFFFYVFSPGKRRNVKENIEATGGVATRRAVYGPFRLHTTNIVEMFASSRWNDETIRDWFTFEGREELNRALAEGRGAVLVTGHIGSWELGARHLQSLGYNMHVVAGVQMNRLLTGAVKEAKELRGIEVINPDNASRKILKVFQSNGILALLVDGNVYTGGVERPLFGRLARVPDGPVRLAKASGAPIVGGYCRRIGNERFAIHIEAIVSARDIKALSDEESLAKVYGAFERYVRENADQWCIFRSIWGARQ